MRRMFIIVLTLACLGSINYGATDAKKDSVIRTWKTISGDTVKAKYIEMKYGKVKLQGEDGKFIVVSEKNRNRSRVKNHIVLAKYL